VESENKTIDQSDFGGLVRAGIERFRSKLLDLSMANRLLNFKSSEKSRNHIRIIDEIPEFLFEKLDPAKGLEFVGISEPSFEPLDEQTPQFREVARRARENDETFLQQKEKLGPRATKRQLTKIDRDLRDRLRMTLDLPARVKLSMSERAKELGINPSYDLPQLPEVPNRRHADSRIQTLFYREDLEAKLSAIREGDRTLLEDAGINALYGAFGFVEWYESIDSEVPAYAPLVFCPVEIKRILEDGLYKYFLVARDDDIETNHAFRELIKANSGLELPTWDPGQALSDYLSKVQSLLRSQPRWRLRRWVTVGLFTFAKLAMYSDLDPKRWVKGGLLENHNVLNDLLVGTSSVSEVTLAPDYEIDSLRFADANHVLITDADSSQHSAVIDVLEGKNVVIQGPPGTGKSQTITNIIAAAMNSGKSVLFIAEKMAALQVVKERLDHFGLGEFCLEVHSNKTRKTSVLRSLEQRINFPGPGLDVSQLRQAIGAYEDARHDLLGYVTKSKAPFGDTGLSALDVLRGNIVRTRNAQELPGTIQRIRIESPESLNAFMREEIADIARELASATRGVDHWQGIERHPWRGVRNSELDVFQCEELQSALDAWTESLSALEQLAEQTSSAFGWSVGHSQISLEAFATKVSDLPSAPIQFDEKILHNTNTESDRNLLASVVRDLKEVSYCRAEIGKLIEQGSALVEMGSVLIQNLAESSREQGLSELSISAAENVAGDRQREAEAIERNVRAALALSALFGLVAPKNSDLRDILRGTALLQSVSAEVLFLRDLVVMDEVNLQKFERGLRQSDALKRSRREHAERFELALTPEFAEVRAAAQVLLGASFLEKVFSKSCRDARRFHKRLLKKDQGSRKENAEHDLANLAMFLQQEQEFRLDAELKQSAGRFFRGEDTPWQNLVKVSQWAEQVRAAFPPSTDGANCIRNFLLLGDIEKIRAVLEAAKRPDYQSFQQLLVMAGEESDVAQSSAATSSRRSATRTNEIVSDLKRLGMNPEARLQSLESLAADLRSLEDARHRLEQENVLRLLGSRAELWVEKVSCLSETHRFASDLAAADMPASVRERLRTGSPAPIIVALKAAGSSIAIALTVTQARQECVQSSANLDPVRWVGQDSFESVEIEQLKGRIRLARSNADSLQPFLNFLRIEDRARSTALSPLMESFRIANAAYERLAESFDFAFYRSCAEKLFAEDRKLAAHTGVTHERLRRRFQQLDRRILELRRMQIARVLMDRNIESGVNRGKASDFSELALIRRQISLQKRHLPLRELFRRAGTAVQGLKPCFMMSPMSVAQFLDPSGLRFDLVVMDEASQIRPEDAVGGIARGKQVVIVGDPMQLPPTQFFEKVDRDDLIEDDSQDAEVQDLVGQESVLDLARGPYQPIRVLRWHYRSQHESLIAFSNREFYGDSLIVFPSPRGTDPEFGVHLVQVDGVYDHSLNRLEAEAVVSAAQAFMRTFSQRSLGIVAMNKPQQQLIQKMMDDLYATDMDAEAYRLKWEGTLEPTFVKNLENVQGDERDVIFISTVYGKDSKGTFYQRLGPLNGVYGHRRLNVLFTRAKQQVKLFTSMKPSDLRLDSTTRWGVKALKNYLSYSLDGHFETGEVGSRETDSEFEHWVMQSLSEKGYEVVTQLGVAGYFIDLAVRHPDKRGSFILGVECDGATYHSARSARDRDRLRQEALERLNWKIYRIWSTDWFRDPRAELQKLVGAIESARRS
jgi:very-short-patch-repair endonuclease